MDPGNGRAVEGKIYRGTEGLLKYGREFFESFSEVKLENSEFRDLGDRVFVLYELRVRGHEIEYLEMLEFVDNSGT